MHVVFYLLGEMDVYDLISVFVYEIRIVDKRSIHNIEIQISKLGNIAIRVRCRHYVKYVSSRNL